MKHSIALKFMFTIQNTAVTYTKFKTYIMLIAFSRLVPEFEIPAEPINAGDKLAARANFDEHYTLLSISMARLAGCM